MANNVPRDLSLHPPNLCVSYEFLGLVCAQAAPPFEQHRIADQLEPRGELETGLGKHLSKFVRRDISSILDFSRVRFQINVSFDKNNVVNYEILELAHRPLCPGILI